MAGRLRGARGTWILAVALVGCGGSQKFALYPERPSPGTGAPVVDPPPSRIVLHATVSRAALEKSLDQAVPKNGGGTFPLLGSERRYMWQRDPFVVSFRSGRLLIDTHAKASVELLGTVQELNIDLHIDTEPVVSSSYEARLQSPEVRVSSPDTRLKVAQSLAGALDKIKGTIEGTLRDFKYDLRPLIDEAYQRVAKPMDLPLGNAKGCAQLSVLGVEAGPTVLADGIEKDLALVVAPSITLPCAAPPTPPPLPPLANVASLQSGPFTVQVPVAARYDELEHAMSLAFTNGKLYFSKELPELYLEKPGVYASRDQLVVKVHIAGRVKKGGIDTTLDGDLYMVGHPTVVDNEIRVPDLEHTFETKSFLLKLANAFSGDSIRESAREALHLDIGERLRQVQAKLSTELSFGGQAPTPPAEPGVRLPTGLQGPPPSQDAMSQGCVRAAVNRFEISAVHPHPSYLRLYMNITGQASVYLPCPK
jgi:hypothetical protein